MTNNKWQDVLTLLDAYNRSAVEVGRNLGMLRVKENIAAAGRFIHDHEKERSKTKAQLLAAIEDELESARDALVVAEFALRPSKLKAEHSKDYTEHDHVVEALARINLILDEGA